MEFGHVPLSMLDTVDFSLPQDPRSNRQSLAAQKGASPKVYTGLNMWGQNEWIGKIYPNKTTAAAMLGSYIRQYNCVELNATHYKLYPAAQIAQWAQKANGIDFKFCPKMYQGITHQGSLLNKEQECNAFFTSIAALQEHLGPVLIQFSDAFDTTRKVELIQFLYRLPIDFDFFIELRHPDWFKKTAETDDFFGLLQKHKIGTVITDAAGRRDCAHMYLTVPTAFIRFVGNSLHPSDYTRVDVWMRRIQDWVDMGLEQLYFFTHMQDETMSPELTLYVIEAMNVALGLQLKPPKWVVPPATLF